MRNVESRDEMCVFVGFEKMNVKRELGMVMRRHARLFAVENLI